MNEEARCFRNNFQWIALSLKQSMKINRLWSFTLSLYLPGRRRKPGRFAMMKPIFSLNSLNLRNLIALLKWSLLLEYCHMLNRIV